MIFALKRVDGEERGVRIENFFFAPLIESELENYWVSVEKGKRDERKRIILIRLWS
jgi:hypothetical protein